jgi:hypothetical protein
MQYSEEEGGKKMKHEGMMALWTIYEFLHGMAGVVISRPGQWFRGILDEIQTLL